MRQSAKLPTTGFQPDGSYVLTDWERQQDCKSLTRMVMWHVGEMKALAQREKTDPKKKKAQPFSLLKLRAKLAGRGPAASEYAADFRREVRVTTALNQGLRDKGCPAIDLAPHVAAEAAYFEVTLPKTP